jgi:hypothetical protein
MLNSLTKSRKPSYYHQLMLKIVIAFGLLWLLWEPIRPVRTVTAEALYTAGDLIAR